MLDWVLKSLLFISLVLIFFQDLKDRKVHLWLLLGFILMSFIISYRNIEVGYLLYNIAFTLLYLALIVLVIKLYFLVKGGTTNLIDKFGWADVLMILGTGIIMKPVEFIFFSTTVYIISILLTLIFLKNRKSIPLAGYMAIFLTVHLLWNTIYST